MSTYFYENKLFAPNQTGCRPGYSTQSAFLYLLQDIRSGIENNQVTVLVSFDLKKAFDSVDHNILLFTLKQYNLSNTALTLIHSYLSKRSQAVLDENRIPSNYSTFTSGVPQGSSPAGLLFNIHINPIHTILYYCKDSYLLFVGDFQIWLKCIPEHINYIVKSLNIEINNINIWFKTHGVTINPLKTQAIIIGTPNDIKLSHAKLTTKLIIENSIIPFSQSIKNLGLTIENDLTWYKQFSSISKKVYGTLHNLRNGAYSFPPHIKLLLANALILPIIDYACPCFCDISKVLDTKLNKMLNSALRFVYNLKKYQLITPFRSKARWLSAKNRRLFFCLTSLYLLIHHNTPPILSKHLSKLTPSSRRTGRNTTSFYPLLSFPNSTQLEQSYIYYSTQEYDRLPSSVKNSSSFDIFKNRLFNYLLELE